jgi:hypothetical protein
VIRVERGGVKPLQAWPPTPVTVGGGGSGLRLASATVPDAAFVGVILIPWVGRSDNMWLSLGFGMWLGLEFGAGESIDLAGFGVWGR